MAKPSPASASLLFQAPSFGHVHVCAYLCVGVGVDVSVPPCLGIGLDRISQYRIVAFHAVFAAEGSSHLLRHFRPGLGVSVLNYFTQHDPSHRGKLMAIFFKSTGHHRTGSPLPSCRL